MFVIQILFNPAELYFMHLPSWLNSSGVYRLEWDDSLVLGGVSVLDLFNQAQVSRAMEFRCSINGTERHVCMRLLACFVVGKRKCFSSTTMRGISLHITSCCPSP